MTAKPQNKLDPAFDDYPDIPLAFDETMLQSPVGDPSSNQYYNFNPQPYASPEYEIEDDYRQLEYPFLGYDQLSPSSSPRMMENNNYKPYQNTGLSYTVSAPYTGYSHNHNHNHNHNSYHKNSHFSQTTMAPNTTTTTNHITSSKTANIHPYPDPSHLRSRARPMPHMGLGKAYSHGYVYGDHELLPASYMGETINNKHAMYHQDDMYGFEDSYRGFDVHAFDQKELTHPSKASRYGTRLDMSRSLPGFENSQAHYRIKDEIGALSDDEPFIKKADNSTTKAEKKYVSKRQSLLRKEDEAIKKEMQERKVEEEKLQKKVSELQEKLNQSKQIHEKCNKELKELTTKWKEEHTQMIQAHGAHTELALDIEKQKDADKIIEAIYDKDSTWNTLLDIIVDSLKEELESLTEQIHTEKKIGNQTKEYNEEIRRGIADLIIEKKQLEEELKIMKEKEIANQPEENNQDTITVAKCSEYPPESTVIQNLLQAQVEFYFSDYNLKRDKRLLQSVIKEHKGFLSLDEVLNLARIRQLCSDKEQLIAALKRSKVLILKDEMVGRERFEKPHEKEFPFRRTVFIYGIPPNANDQFLQRMLSPFGTITKVKFDSGPESLDRITGRKFLARAKVYQLYTPDKHLPMEFVTKGSHERLSSAICHSCQKLKLLVEGFYVSESWKVIYCAQCAAHVADQQLSAWYARKADRAMLLGAEPTDLDSRKTALVVFASQRQASKCAYVRTRIGYEGAFATHYHHFSKIKKETAQSMSSDKTKLTQSASVPEDVEIQFDEENVPIDQETQPIHTSKSHRSQQKSASGITYEQSDTSRQKPVLSQHMLKNANSKKKMQD